MTATTDARAVARADLCRTASFSLRALDDADRDGDGDGRTIDGYAAVYGRDLAAGEEPSAAAGWALIDSWEGTFWERFRFGAFRKSLREQPPRMQFDHGRHPLLGSLPLGRWESVTEEDGAGLHTVGRLSDNWLIEPFRDAIKDRAVDGMSIRFTPSVEEWRASDGRLIRDEAELMSLLWTPDETLGPLQRTVKSAWLPEAGPVTWPAYEATSVGVRSASPSGRIVIDLGRIGAPEMRRELARAVYLADRQSGEETSPVAPQRATGTEPAGEHEPRQDDDTQRTTAPSAGEHESVSKRPIRKQDHVDLARARAAVRPFQDAIDEVAAVLASL